MNNKGFTFVELVVVVALVSILAAIAIPNYSQWRAQSQVKQVARDVLSGLRQARSTAIAEGGFITATIDPVNHLLTYGTESLALESHIKLSVSTTSCTANLTSAASKATKFLSNGSCNSELYVVVAENPDYCVAIDSTAAGLAKLP